MRRMRVSIPRSPIVGSGRASSETDQPPFFMEKATPILVKLDFLLPSRSVYSRAIIASRRSAIRRIPFGDCSLEGCDLWRSRDNPTPVLRSLREVRDIGRQIGRASCREGVWGSGGGA